MIFFGEWIVSHIDSLLVLPDMNYEHDAFFDKLFKIGHLRSLSFFKFLSDQMYPYHGADIFLYEFMQDHSS